MNSPLLSAIDASLLQTPAPNALFTVEDAAYAWIVRSGKLDLFLVGTRDLEPVGARSHIVRVQEGEAIFGIGPAPDGFALMASATPGTRVTRLRQSELREMATDEDNESQVIAMLETWIMRLTEALAGDLVHGPYVALESGQRVAVADEPKALVSKHELLWVAHLEGESKFLGCSEVPALSCQDFFPLAKGGWLQATPHSAVVPVDSAAFLRLDVEWHGLELFHAAAKVFIGIKFQDAASRELNRIEARSAFDSVLLDVALRTLAAPIRKTDEFADGLQSCHDPVFLACAAIGKRLGVKIRPAPEMLRNMAVPDPVEAIGRASKIRVRRVALKDSWWKNQTGCLLAVRELDDRPVALLPRASGRLDMYDPVERKTVPVTARVAAQLSSVAYILYRPLPSKKLNVFDLLKYSLPHCKAELVTILLTGIVSGALGIMIPIVTGIVFDRLIPAAEKAELMQMSVFLLLILVSMSIVNMVGSYASLRLQGRTDASLQAAVWDRLLSLPVSFFRQYSSGELAQRSLAIASIQQILTGSTLNAMLTGVFSIFSFLLLFYFDWKLALIATGLVAIAFMLTIICGVLQLRKLRELIQLQANVSSLLLQLIGGISKFRVSGTEKRAFAAWARQFSWQKKLSTQARSISNVLGVFNSVFPLIASGVIFYCYSQQAVTAGARQMSTGEFLAFLSAFGQFLTVALILGSIAVQSLSIVPIYEMAKPILSADPEVTEGKTTPGKLTGAVDISHVSFRYKPDTPPVLRDLTLSIKPGQFVAFVGASGSGKSTLLRLLLGFEAPSSGSIYYDNHDLSALDVQAVRRQLGVVLQSCRPVNGSILRNIIGSAPLTLEDAWEAARLAGIDEDIKKMPMGMNTHISDGGGNISGGQRQRLMVARAIVGRPQIVILDEATSALDNHTQAVVSRSLESLKATRIVIAHRLSTIMHADCIYVLDKGTIVQKGTFNELMEHGGLFKELVQRQML